MKITIVSPPANHPYALYEIGDFVRVIAGSEAGRVGFIVNLNVVDFDQIEYELDSCDFLVWESELESV